MGKSFLAILAGYLLMALTVAVATPIAVALFVPPEVRGAKVIILPPAYYVADFVLYFAAAVAGGWLTARIAPRNPLAHTAALTAVIAIVAVLFLAGFGGAGEPSQVTQPSWYTPAISVTGVVGAMLGGVLRVRGLKLGG